MSEFKTEVAGAESVYSQSSGNSLYSRVNTVQDSRRTYVERADISATQEKCGVMSDVKNVTKNSQPVVGFLYSISRQGIGEYWPLHIGRNTIGRSDECDICLREATVSDLHASLNIKQMKTTHKTLASIRDEGSRNGIFVNEEELDYSVHEVKNHDKILVGDNYELLLILIDCEFFNLKIADNFRSLDDGSQPFYASPTSNMYSSEERPENGTTAMDGASPEYGKTKYL